MDVWNFYQPIYGDLFSLKSIPCYHCGNVLYREKSFVVQVIPSSMGGTHTIANLRVACFNCTHESIGITPYEYAVNNGHNESPAINEALATMEDCEDLYQRLNSVTSCTLL